MHQKGKTICDDPTYFTNVVSSKFNAPRNIKIFFENLRSFNPRPKINKASIHNLLQENYTKFMINTHSHRRKEMEKKSQRQIEEIDEGISKSYMLNGENMFNKTIGKDSIYLELCAWDFW